MFSQQCDHSYTVDDVRSGTTVCTTCALVLTPTLFVGLDIPYPTITVNPVINNTYPSVDQWLNQTCENLNIPTKRCIEAMDLRKKTIQKLECTRKISRATLKHELAASLFRVLKCSETPLTLCEISSSAGVSVRSISNAYKTLFDHEYVHLKPSDTISRYCAKLRIDRKKAVELQKKMKNCKIDEIQCHHSATVAASSIYVLVKQQSLNVTLKQICDVIGLSAISISRFINRYNLHQLLT